MHALVFHGPRDIRFESYPDPTLGNARCAILRVSLTSICGSDLHIYHGDRIGQTDYSQPQEPFCVGHEVVGEVLETGTDVQRFKVGDRVLVSPGGVCGRCQACTSGDGFCSHAGAWGLSAHLQGGQAELFHVGLADAVLHRIPDGVSDEQALLMTDAMGTAHFGITRADVGPGDIVAIVGLGPIGLLGIEIAFARGASQVLAIDPIEGRRAHAEHLGATPIPPGDDARGIVKELTRGRMADRVFEASGADASVRSVPGLLRNGGTASFIGLPQGDTALPLRQLLYRNLTVRAGIASPQATWPELTELIREGKVLGAGLFTHSLPLADGADGYRIFNAREDGVLKVAFDSR